MRYVLSRLRQEAFCNSIISGGVEDEDSEMKAMIDGCKDYYFEVHGNTYFLSRDIERRIKLGNGDNKYVSSVFEIINEVNFYIETLNYDFIEFLLKNPSNKAYDLDEEMCEIHESYLSRYGY